MKIHAQHSTDNQTYNVLVLTKYISIQNRLHYLLQATIFHLPCLFKMVQKRHILKRSDNWCVLERRKNMKSKNYLDHLSDSSSNASDYASDTTSDYVSDKTTSAKSSNKSSNKGSRNVSNCHNTSNSTDRQ